MSFSLNRFFVRFLLILRTGGPLLLLIVLTYRLSDDEITRRLQDEVFSESGMSSRIWLYAGLSLVMALVYPVATTLITIGSLKTKSLLGSLAYLRRQASPVIREQMRALGISLLWGIPLIVPTFWKLFQFLYVPFIVCLDPRYSTGNIHAPRRSAELVRRKFWPTFFVATLMFLILPTIIIGFEGEAGAFDNPLKTALLTLIEFTILLTGQLLLIRLWEKAHGTDFQLS